MPYSVAGKNAMLNALGAAFVSLHTDIPNDSGSNEVTGGSPAYARKAVTVGAASGGSVSFTNNPVFDVPAATTVEYMGLWTLVTGGTFLGYMPINGGNILGAATADATTDAFTDYAHGLANGDRVAFQAVMGASLPGGISASTLYFVVGSTTNTFQVSLTSGGSAVNITTSSEATWQKTIPSVYTLQGTLTVNSGVYNLLGTVP